MPRANGSARVSLLQRVHSRGRRTEVAVIVAVDEGIDAGAGVAPVGFMTAGKLATGLARMHVSKVFRRRMCAGGQQK